MPLSRAEKLDAQAVFRGEVPGKEPCQWCGGIHVRAAVLPSPLTRCGPARSTRPAAPASNASSSTPTATCRGRVSREMGRERRDLA